MSRSLSIILIFLVTISCQENHEVDIRSIEFIEEQNLKLSQEVISNYLGKGKRENEKQIYDNILTIRTSKNSLNKHYSNGNFENEFLEELKNHKYVLDSISKISQYNNLDHLEMIQNNMGSLEKNPFDFFLVLSLYEYELLNHHASSIGGIGTLFISSIQFSKNEYQQNEEVLFTNTVFETEYYKNFKYDSVSFIHNNKKLNLDYSIEQIVNTAIVTFEPLEPGIYHINLHTSFDTHLQNRITDKISTSIKIKN